MFLGVGQIGLFHSYDASLFASVTTQRLQIARPVLTVCALTLFRRRRDVIELSVIQLASGTFADGLHDLFGMINEIFETHQDKWKFGVQIVCLEKKNQE